MYSNPDFNVDHIFKYSRDSLQQLHYVAQSLNANKFAELGFASHATTWQAMDYPSPPPLLLTILILVERILNWILFAQFFCDGFRHHFWKFHISKYETVVMKNPEIPDFWLSSWSKTAFPNRGTFNIILFCCETK